MTLSDRPTPELVMLILATMVGLTILLAGAGVVALALWRPELDISEAVHSLTQTITLVVGAVVGYLAGDRRKGLPSPSENGTPGAGTPSV